MNPFTALSPYQAEALVACLIASVVWAGLLLFGARFIERRGVASSADRLWIAALLIAMLPSLLAPGLAALGVSLRPAPPAPAVVETVAIGPAIADIASASPAATPATTAAPLPPVTADQIIGAAAMLYIYGVVLALIIWAGRQLAFSFATAQARKVEDEELLARIEDWACAMGLPAPRVRQSRHLSSVCVHGAFRPAILIPDDIESRITREDLALMCAHELAHLKRGDTKLFTATALARVLFWFNPLVREIAARVELAAEERADAVVLGAGVDRREYAACFVKGLRFAASRTGVQPALMPSFTPPDREGRRRRLNSILSGAAPSRLSLSARLLLGGAASSAALLAVGQAALAVDPQAAAAKKQAAQEALLSKNPVKGETTLGFKAPYADLENGEAKRHSGVDIAAPFGQEVVAAGDGVVVEATDFYTDNPKWGKVVVIDHGHGLLSRYAHLDRYAVHKGDAVKAGQAIGAVGATGKVTGPHLHFEVLKDGKAVDPALALARVDAVAPEAPIAPGADEWDAAEAPAPLETTPPAEASEPLAAPEPAEAPEPPEPVMRRLSFAFPDDAKEAVARIGEDGNLARLKDRMVFAFGGGEKNAFALADDASALSVKLGRLDDLDEKLLGAIEGDLPQEYDLVYSINGKVYRFSSDEPLTPERRAELKEAIEAMRAEREKAQAAAEIKREKAHADWARERARLAAETEREREDMAREMARARSEAAIAMKEARIIAIASSRSGEEADAYRREALEAELSAIDDAEADLADSSDADFSGAFADLEIEAADIKAADISERERRAALAQIEQAWAQVEAAQRNHKRAIDDALDGLKERRDEIRKELRAMKQEDSR
jgi:murein DD-endopeptidase MepM/ murein hydrolase activator NlpD